MSMASLFSYVGMRELAKYLGTSNLATAAVALKGAGSSPDLATTSTQAAWVGGVYIPSVAAVDPIDLSSAVVAPTLAGAVVADGATQWALVCQKGSDGTALVLDAGTAAAPKIPYFDPDTYVAVGLVKFYPSGGACTIGTTNLNTTAVAGRVALYQLTGNVFPHADNFDQN